MLVGKLIYWLASGKKKIASSGEEERDDSESTPVISIQTATKISPWTARFCSCSQKLELVRKIL